MCAVNSRKPSPDQLTTVLERMSKSNITLSELEKAADIFDKVSDILIQLKCPSAGLCSIDNVNRNSNEYFVQGQIKRLRSSSIDLLKCKKYIMKTKSHLSGAKKRKLSDTDIEITEAKRINTTACRSSLAVQRFEEATIGKDSFQLCYICKKNCTTDYPRHEFYPWMCVQCGNFNFKKRNQMADLNNKVALVTGGRIKIGFEIALKLLRCGATVIITTRFPNDARKRYTLQDDFTHWSNRLHICGLDLRFIPQVHKFVDYFTTHFRQLDILIQNAAQTIRRPTVYYKTLIEGERNQASLTSNSGESLDRQHKGSVMELETSNSVSYFSPAETSQLLIHPEDFKYSGDTQLSQLHFPPDAKDDDGDQLDLRPHNTWIAALEQVETQEMVEVTLANYMAPFIILKKLAPLMTEGRTEKSNFAFVILVSAMEGKFSSCYKTGNHPHTNAAKAALNMLVRTSAHHYRKQGIVMNAVDTGWVTDEHPIGCKSKLTEGLKPPLDSIDGAARVLDPILQTVNNGTKIPIYGKFLKDYRPVGW